MVSSDSSMSAKNNQYSTFSAPKGFSKVDLIGKSPVSQDFLSPNIEAHSDSNKQVWLIRIPEGFDPKNLDGVTLKIDTFNDDNEVEIQTTNQEKTEEANVSEQELAMLGWSVTDESKTQKPISVIPTSTKIKEKFALYDITKESKTMGTSMATLTPLIRNQNDEFYSISKELKFDRLISIEDLDELHH